MKNTLLIVTLPIALAACATRAPQKADIPPIAASDVAQAQGRTSPRRLPVAQTSRAAGEEKVEEALPAMDLSEELLFKLLSSEIALQRGEWQSAYVTVLGAAQQTRDPRLARRAAEIALGAKQVDEALAAVRLWRSIAPESDEAAQYYLSFAILTENLAEAKPILEQRLKEARPQTRGLLAFQMQRLLARAKDKTAAFALLEEVLAPYRDLPEARLALAQAAFANGDAERARREAQAALRSKPDSELAVLALAQVTPDKAAATGILRDFLNRYPKSRDVRLAHARLLVEQKEYPEARREFETLLKDEPDDLTSLYALGVLAAQTNDLKAAEAYLTRYLSVLESRPDEERDPSQALLLLAQIAEERKDSEAVLKWLGQIEPGEAFLSAQVKRAQVMAKRGELDAARKLLQEVPASGEREQAQLIIAEGQLLRDNGQLPAALDVLRQGMKRFPSNTDLLYDFAMLAEKRGLWDEMESALRKIMSLAPDNQHAYNALGYSLAERNIRLDEAHALIEKALKLAPDDPFIIDSMGWIQFRLGRLKEAEDLLRRAYALRPDVEIATHLGEVLWVRGQRDDAQKLWRDAQNKDPQNDTLKSTLARLNVRL
ncbi:MAG TPA: tetratricopeptide repeat protein [Noviherbaspirillum sp.]|uniref:tetratricopeptide repeat protein n=1 Tax=Noviherbaspirillum sp. TaxID=1926288 RepID=UPI002F95C1D5